MWYGLAQAGCVQSTSINRTDAVRFSKSLTTKRLDGPRSLEGTPKPRKSCDKTARQTPAAGGCPGRNENRRRSDYGWATASVRKGACGGHGKR